MSTGVGALELTTIIATCKKVVEENGDKPALKVERDGKWFTVKTKPLSIIVNIGDMVQVWSNDRYKAPLHRVLASDVSTRYSAPYFLNPSFKTNYAPLASMCTNESPRYREINWGAFREGRAAGDYADVGDEIQIAHYRVTP